MGITTESQQWEDIPSITEESGIRREWRELIANGEAVEEGSLVKKMIADMCLYNAVGAFKFLPTFDTTGSQGPYCVRDYNKNVRTWARKVGPQEAPPYIRYVKRQTWK